MSVFIIIFHKILTALLCVGLGYSAGKHSGVKKDSIAKLLFNYLVPIVFFAIPTSSTLEISTLGITVIVFFLACILGVINYKLFSHIFSGTEPRILAFSSGTGNAAVLGLPIANAIFDDKTVYIYALGIIGMMVFEATVGAYFCVKSSKGLKQSITNVVKMPMLAAFSLGAFISYCGFQLPEFLSDFMKNMTYVYSVMGMIMLGLSIIDIQKFKFDFKFVGAAFISKFIFAPLLFNILIGFDNLFTHFLSKEYCDALQLLSLMPMATTCIIMGTLYKLHPEKVSSSVLLSLLFVLIYMPLMASFLLT